ncbi:MAG: hypothetical protein TREMPRED_005660, partial [Tremellales sp. Tagirdzhanova-0007]
MTKGDRSSESASVYDGASQKEFEDQLANVNKRINAIFNRKLIQPFWNDRCGKLFSEGLQSQPTSDLDFQRNYQDAKDFIKSTARSALASHWETGDEISGSQ